MPIDMERRAAHAPPRKSSILDQIAGWFDVVDGTRTYFFPRGIAPMAGKDQATAINDDRREEAEGADRGGDLRGLPGAVYAGVVGIAAEAREGQVRDRELLDRDADSRKRVRVDRTAIAARGSTLCG